MGHQAKKLTEKLNPFVSGRAEVWFDERLAPGVYFKEEIQQKLKDTPVFVAVVSPSYLESEFSIIHES
jgi:TIR domain-containing protein